MKKHLLASLVLSLLLAAAAWAAPSEPQVVLDSGGSSVIWAIDGFDYGLAELTVVGPRKIVRSQQVDRGERPKFTAVDDAGRPVDGVYSWNLVVRSYLGEDLLAQIAKERLYDKDDLVCELKDQGVLQSFQFSGTFQQIDGKVYLPTDETEKSAEGLEKPNAAPTFGDAAIGHAADKTVLSGDLTVYNSLCVGFDCAANETYSFDTIRLKENNLRIHFDDTSTAASFPRNDWRLIANDSANGGASKFSLDDVTGGTTPLTVRAGAPSNSLFVNSSGRVGFGTSSPAVELHSRNGDTPTLRLEQDGSSGFASQSWDLAGNETSFFIRDATNGSTLPFRLRPGAPSNTLVIDTDGDVGIGTLTADSALHMKSGGDVQLKIESTGGGSSLEMIQLENDAKVAIRMVNNAAADTWDFSNDGNFNISKVGTGANEFSLSDLGTLTIRGNLIALGGDGSVDPGDTFPDYVFAPEYELMSIDELEAFVNQRRHLPNVPSAADISAAGGINMTELQLRMLEKVEELTLYTISQEKTMRSQEETIEAQAELIRQLAQRLEALEASN